MCKKKYIVFACFFFPLYFLSTCGEKRSEIVKTLITQKSIDVDATYFYISPHPDDWQLFMGEYAFDTIKNEKTKVVIIHTTAGDAGRDGFWQAREKASLASVRSVFHWNLLDGDPSEQQNDIQINAKNINHRTLKNVEMYFLRLPDGQKKGQGTDFSDSQSMEKLYKGDIPSIKSVDGHNTFTLDELKQTMTEIIKKEHPDMSKSVQFFMLDPGPLNDLSHSDHYISQVLARDVISDLSLPQALCKIRSFEDYRIKWKDKNLPSPDVNKKMLLFLGYNTSMLSHIDHCDICAESHYEWLFRSYNREFECHD